MGGFTVREGVGAGKGRDGCEHDCLHSLPSSTSPGLIFALSPAAPCRLCSDGATNPPEPSLPCTPISRIALELLLAGSAGEAQPSADPQCTPGKQTLPSMSSSPCWPSHHGKSQISESCILWKRRNQNFSRFLSRGPLRYYRWLSL